jgi:hypothetical protein
MRLPFIVLVISFALAQTSFATFDSTELFVISWGDGTDNLIASKAYHVDPGTPEDSTDDYFDSGNGPSAAFVDRYGTIVIIDPDFQLKGFGLDGALIFDFSADSPDHKRGMFWGGARQTLRGQHEAHISDDCLAHVVCAGDRL